MPRIVKDKEKRPYTKPKVEQVELIAEEAVLAGCKAATNIKGPGFWKCHTNMGTCRSPAS